MEQFENNIVSELKACPKCGASIFSDMDACYKCTCELQLKKSSSTSGKCLDVTSLGSNLSAKDEQNLFNLFLVDFAGFVVKFVDDHIVDVQEPVSLVGERAAMSTVPD